ncbi:MAG: hypothetical protein JO102_02480, partial [Elusimicrobia bacterium]|nr:hypothetical protein [Elusimicrobiota bacterium]
MKWPKLRDIFAFLPVVDGGYFSVEEDAALDDPASTPQLEPAREEMNDRWRNIRFDNAIRLWVSIPTYLTCLALRAGGAIPTAWPMTVVFTTYVLIQYLVLTVYLNIGFPRSSDFILAGLDLVAMSASVFFTGGASSPIYFIFFVPLVVHAFHRDLNVVLFSGFGGVAVYGLAVLLSLTTLNPAAIADLGARLVFMMLTVAIACLALSLLRRKDALDRKRVARLRAISVLSHRLNHACSTKELLQFCGGLGGVLGAAIPTASGAATVIILLADRRRGVLAPVDASPVRVPVEMLAASCPCFVENRVIREFPAGAHPDCRVDGSASRSNICMPISIEGGAP